jgi:SagB-type dehydrogenase family enzyme
VVRLRRARAIVLLLEGSDVVAFDYLRRARVALTPLALGLLTAAAEWASPAAIFAAQPPGIPRDAIAATLTALLDGGFVVAEGSAEAARDARYERGWPWGPQAGLFHFALKDPAYQKPDVVAAWLAQQVATAPPPAMVQDNRGCVDEIPLATPRLDDGGPLGLMARRRSYRGYDEARGLPLAALADCLFAGFAILGFAPGGVPGDPPLPVATTPSGGARNPFEAYVVARRVDGLAAGVYHYDGVAHALGRLPAPAPAELSSLLGDQEWFAPAAAVVFLVACFARSAWKYPHPGAFRVVLIEAGHVAQNVLLAATHHGLAAAPTCALSDAAIEGLLGLDRVTHAALHAVVLGPRGARPSSGDLGEIRWNPRFR